MNPREKGALGKLIVAGVALAGTLIWGFRNEKKRLEEEAKKEREIDALGGKAKIQRIELVSANYKGKRKTSGSGIPVEGYGDDWDEAEFNLKFEAAKNGKDIILDVIKEGSRRDGFKFSGVAYCKK